MCYTPQTIADANKIQHTVPCGKCPDCAARRASGWSFRLMQEEKISHSAYFMTLTYDTLSVSITKNRFLTLCKRDVQLYFKRLRKNHAGVPIKYYCVGEYGGLFNRPHYHIILFNADLNVMLTKKDIMVLEQSGYDGKSELMQNDWKLGHTTFGKVTGASIGYTMKYISKGRQVPKHKNDDRTPEFSLISKGIGRSYLTKAMVAWHTAIPEERLYCTSLDGKKLSMPRYYKDRIYNKEQRGYIAGYFEKQMAKEGIKKIREISRQEYSRREREYAESVKHQFLMQKIFDNTKSIL